MESNTKIVNTEFDLIVANLEATGLSEKYTTSFINLGYVGMYYLNIESKAKNGLITETIIDYAINLRIKYGSVISFYVTTGIDGKNQLSIHFDLEFHSRG